MNDQEKVEKVWQMMRDRAGRDQPLLSDMKKIGEYLATRWESAAGRLVIVDCAEGCLPEYTNGSPRDISEFLWGTCMWSASPLGHEIFESVCTKLDRLREANSYE